tara:strand:+ start:1007 stop:1129 length:123 start_codon:yes stop_codon:yes gene_type:complete
MGGLLLTTDLSWYFGVIFYYMKGLFSLLDLELNNIFASKD